MVYMHMGQWRSSDKAMVELWSFFTKMIKFLANQQHHSLLLLLASVIMPRVSANVYLNFFIFVDVAWII